MVVLVQCAACLMMCEVGHTYIHTVYNVHTVLLLEANSLHVELKAVYGKG